MQEAKKGEQTNKPAFQTVCKIKWSGIGLVGKEACKKSNNGLEIRQANQQQTNKNILTKPGRLWNTSSSIDVQQTGGWTLRGTRKS